jgi:long-subunit acyl-CoA synthetase (AMP-forming)
MEKILFPLDMFYQFEKQLAQQIYLRQPIEGVWIEYSWEQVGLEARKFAQALLNLNLPPQSNIAILSKNCAHWIIADLGIWIAGHISVPLYPTLNPESMEYVLRHCGAKVLIAGKLEEWDQQQKAVPEGIKVVSFPFWHNEKSQSWESFLNGVKPLSTDFRPDPAQVATIIYTSGTTGQPKGVVHTFKSLSAHMRQAMKLIDINSRDRFFSYLPLSHVAERLLIELGSLYCGGSISFAESIESFKRNLKEVRPTIFLAVPRIWLKFQQGVLHKMPQKKLNRLLWIPLLNTFVKNKIKKEMGLDQVHYAITGAAAMPKDLLVWFDHLGVAIEEVYGMTENFGVSSFNLPGKIRYGTVGTIWPNTQIKIAQDGEILSKSDANMLGYYREPEKTAEVIDSEGWLHTGDKGVLDQEGYLKITGRVKDLFKTSKGKYIAPAILEEFFVASEMVEQVCVLGAGLAQPIALVILSQIGKEAAEENVHENISELMKFINKKVEAHERLDRIVILKDDWSIANGFLTPTLKIKRNVVEKNYEFKIDQWAVASESVFFCL